MENIILIILCALFATVMLVFVIIGAVTVAGKTRRYKQELSEYATANPQVKYNLEIVQNGGTVQVESKGKIMSVEYREE